jgi:hypothetical protein
MSTKGMTIAVPNRDNKRAWGADTPMFERSNTNIPSHSLGPILLKEKLCLLK